jgi:ribulose 1,5-bisphosphate carboxylase large subunit-like protein
MDQSHIYKTMQEAITGSATRPLASGTIVGKEGDNIIYADITDDTLIQLGWRFTGHPQGCAVGSSGDR